MEFLFSDKKYIVVILGILLTIGYDIQKIKLYQVDPTNTTSVRLIFMYKDILQHLKQFKAQKFHRSLKNTLTKCVSFQSLPTYPLIHFQHFHLQLPHSTLAFPRHIHTLIVVAHASVCLPRVHCTVNALLAVVPPPAKLRSLFWYFKRSKPKKCKRINTHGVHTLSESQEGKAKHRQKN